MSTPSLAELANQAAAKKVAAEQLGAYWAKYDPNGERRARLSKRPEDRARTSRAIAARMDAEYRAGLGLEASE